MITPLGAMVLLKEIKQEELATKSGLLITKTSTLGDLKRGRVVAKGAGDRDRDGNYHEIPLAVDDVVLYNDNNATDVTDDGEDYVFINWNHLFGVVA